MSSPKSSPVFEVHRREPELVTPARPTPREVKELSDIDDQDGLRYHLTFAYVYKSNPSMRGVDPARVIREALAQALVFYYPIAGRLREGPNRKLSVDCTGEGVSFVEADADVELELLGEPPEPLTCSQELVYNDPGFLDIIDKPLFHIQVTRFKCGGFIMSTRYVHAVVDGFGLKQFLKAISELACGASAPSTLPVWRRHVLNARDPPTVTCAHPEYDKNTGPILPFADRHVIDRYFFFGPSEVSALRNLAPDHLGRVSTKFELVTACLWRSRVRALNLDPDDPVRLNFAVNARGMRDNNPLPEGYYGNGFMLPAAVTTAGRLSGRPFGYAVELVREAKGRVTGEYVQSTADLLVVKGRPFYFMENSFFVSDVTQLGSGGVDFGWGEPVLEGPTTTEEGLTSYYLSFKNESGEVGRGWIACSGHGQVCERIGAHVGWLIDYHVNALLYFTSLPKNNASLEEINHRNSKLDCHVQSDLFDFFTFNVGSSYHCEEEFIKCWIVHDPPIG